MGRAVASVLVAGAWLAMAVAPAAAKRPATSAELAAIAPAILPAPGERQFNGECLQGSVTTTGDEAWAIVGAKSDDDCPTAGGGVILERVGGVWQERAQGSGWGDEVCGLSHIGTMPEEAGLDLGLCVRSRTIRSATAAELSGLARVLPSQPAGCLRAGVAKRAPGVALVRLTASWECGDDGRELLLVKRGSGWRVALRLDAVRPSCREPGISERAMRALVGTRCGNPRAWWIPAGYRKRLVRQPRAFMYGPQFSFTQVRWARWGAGEVTATAHLVHSYREQSERGRVHVTLSGEQRCGGRSTYKTLTMRPLRPGDRRQLGVFTGDWPIRCDGG